MTDVARLLALAVEIAELPEREGVARFRIGTRLGGRLGARECRRQRKSGDGNAAEQGKQ